MTDPYIGILTYSHRSLRRLGGGDCSERLFSRTGGSDDDGYYNFSAYSPDSHLADTEKHSLTCAIPSSLSIDSPQWSPSDCGRRRGSCIRRGSLILILSYVERGVVELLVFSVSRGNVQYVPAYLRRTDL